MKTRVAALLAFAILPLLGSGCAEKSDAESLAAATTATPDSFRVVFQTSRGRFVAQINRAWAPKGVDRFHELVQLHFFDDQRFFRVVPGFVVQFGINGNPKVNEPWDAKPLADDSVRQSNVRGTLVFATEGPDTRTHQLFVNLGNNVRLDPLGFAPIGRVIEGMAVVDSLYDGYGEAPDQDMIQSMGNAYLDRRFPKLDRIETVRIAPTP